VGGCVNDTATTKQPNANSHKLSNTYTSSLRALHQPIKLGK
jgi:hypothetical protein